MTWKMKLEKNYFRYFAVGRCRDPIGKAFMSTPIF
jgi:hypothetical protein